MSRLSCTPVPLTTAPGTEQRCRRSSSPSTLPFHPTPRPLTGRCGPQTPRTRASAPPALPLPSSLPWRPASTVPPTPQTSLPSLPGVSADKTCWTAPSTATGWRAVTAARPSGTYSAVAVGRGAGKFQCLALCGRSQEVPGRGQHQVAGQLHKHREKMCATLASWGWCCARASTPGTMCVKSVCGNLFKKYISLI